MPTFVLLGLALLLSGALSSPGKAASSASSSAATLARQLAAELKAKKDRYNRALCARFQRAAGLQGRDVDGLYGPKTRTLLARYVTAPPAVFASSGKKKPAAPVVKPAPRPAAPQPRLAPRVVPG